MANMVRSLGRVAGNRWYAGSDFNKVKNPLDGDMFFHSESSFVYQYDEKNKKWIKILEFESKIVEELINKKLVNYVKKNGDELTGNFKLKNYISSFVNDEGRNILKTDFDIILGNNIDKTEIRNLDKIYARSKKNGDTYTTGEDGQILSSDGNGIYWQDNNFVNEEKLEAKLEQYVTLNTPQEIDGNKKFNKPIELAGDDINGRIYPGINDKGLVGMPNNHFKQGYVNELYSNGILPISTDGISASSAIGSIGSYAYNWLNAYIKNIYANKLYENGIALDEKYLIDEDIKDLVDKTYVDQKIAELINGATEDFDTLKELEEALKNNRDIMDAINEAIAKKADKVDLNAHIEDKNNPHDVKIDQIENLRTNLDNLENEISKNSESIEENAKTIDDHIKTVNGNPHNVKIEEIEGLKDALDKGTSDNTATGELLKTHINDKENPHEVRWNQVIGLEEKLEDSIGEGILTIETKLGENKTTIATFSANDKNNVIATIDVPEIPNVGNGGLTIRRNGSDLGTFYANQDENQILDIVVPATVEELTDSNNYVKKMDNISSLNNDAGYITLKEVPEPDLTEYVKLENGLVPKDKLPSYVDDVLEFNSRTDFPIEGEKGKIYVDILTDFTYRWSGTQYIQIGGKDTAEIETDINNLKENTIKKGDNISLLNNDAGYITLEEVPTPEKPDLSNYIQKNDNISSLNNDVGYITLEDIPEPEKPDLSNYVKKNDNVSLLNNDAGYITMNDIDLSSYVSDDEFSTTLQSYAQKDLIHDDKIKALEDSIKNITGGGSGDEDLPTLDNVYTKAQTDNLLAFKVDKTTTINGKSLSGNISLTKSDVGLGSVDNTSDLAKPISTATQNALDNKVDKTTTVNGKELSSNITIGKGDVGLGNVDNTSDLAKPISTATQNALDLKASTTYVDQKIASLVDSSPDTLNTLNELAAALGDDPNFATTVSGKIGEKISGPESSTDNAIVRYDGNTGKKAQNSSATIDDSGNITSSGYKITGKNNDYILLAGGGTIAKSDFASSNVGDSYLPLSGGTMAGSIKLVENKESLNLRTHGTYESGIVYGTSGNEALTIAMQNPVTAFQIVYGTKPSAFTGDTWQAVTPLFQTKDGKVIINRKIAATADTSLLKLFDVNGEMAATTIYEDGTALSSKYLGIGAKAADSDKLDGQDGSYYLNYQNFTNKPTISNSTISIATSGALTGGGTFTLNQGGSVDAITISLGTTGVTAGTYGTAQTPSHGGTFAIPTFKVDVYGRLISAGTVNITLPTDNNVDTKNTTGSSSTSSKIYLVGATSQSDYAQTYSDSEVYVTDGILTTNKIQVGVGSATMEYDSSLQALKFVFA